MKTFYLILFILFPSISFASSSSADYVFLVENTAMVDSYYNIFNALASIFQSESYMDLLKLAFLFGGFLMLTKGVFATYEGSANAKMISEYGKYLATVVGLLVIISGKSTIWITTNNIPTYCSTSSPTVGTAVDNIPSVLAYSFTVANTIGNGLTELAESGFTNATESTMTKSDGYLGNLKETIKVLTLDPSKTSVENDFDFTNMWSVFFSDCVYMPSINQGQEGAKVLSDAYKTKDLLNYSETLMGHTFSEGASISQIGDSTVKYMGQTYTCSAFLETLKSLTNTHLSNFTCTLPLANSGVLELITGNVNSGSTGASEMNGIARQAGLITAFKGSKAINSIGIQGADSFTGGTTKASFNMSSLSSASYMADMMPYVQMTLRAVLYAFFPFIFVVIILPGGLKVLAQYSKTLIWIELWTPTAAILHMFVSIHAKDKLSTMYSNSTGVTLMNSIDMLSETATLAGVGAMLYVSVPAITWLMITGSGQMLGNVMSGVGASFQSQLKSDQSGMELAKDLQRQKMNQKIASDSEGKQAALSYGEMMFYENLHKGHQDAGTFASNQNIMKSGGELYDKTFVENQSRYFDAMTKKEELKTLGVTDKNGNLDYNKLKEVSQKKGDTAGADAARTMEKYDFDGNGKVSNEEIQQAISQGTKADQLKTQEELKKAMGTIAQIGGGSVQIASEVNSKTAVNEQDIKNQTQQKVLDNVKDINKISTSKAKTETAAIKSNEDTSQEDLNEAAKSKLIYDTEKAKEQFNGDEKKQAGVDANQAIVENKVKENIQNTYSPEEQIKAETFDKGVKIEESLQTQEKGITEKDLGDKTAYNRQKDLIEMAAGIEVASKVGKQISEAKTPELKALKEEAMKAGIKENDNLGMGLYMSKRMQDSSASSNNFDSENFRKKLNLNESEAGALNALEKVGTGKAISEVKEIFGEKGVENITMANKLISMGGNAAKLGKSVLDVMSNIAETNGVDLDIEKRQKSLESEMKHNDKNYDRNTKMEKDLKEQLNNESNPTKKKELEKELNSIDKEKNKIETKQDKIQDKLDNLDREKTKNDFKKNNLNKIYNKLAPMMETALTTGSKLAGPTAFFSLGMKGDNSSEIPTFNTKEEQENWEKEYKSK